MARCDWAKRKFNTLNHIWKDKGLGRMLRLSIYLRGVISKLVYGNEAWRLRKTEVRALNGWNSRCVSRITGQTSHEEASEKTRTIDIVAVIRCRRREWLGHILDGPRAGTATGGAPTGRTGTDGTT